MSTKFYQPPQDFFQCLSWDFAHAFVCIIEPHQIADLIQAAGGWDELCEQAGDEKSMPPVKTLAAMRVLMTVDEFWEGQEWLHPTQDWVAKKLREFLEWYVSNHGEPPPSQCIEEKAAVASGV